MKSKRRIKIAFAAAECAPLAKVGGLGDVVGSLAKALAKTGCDARIILPFYQTTELKKTRVTRLSAKIKLSGEAAPIKLWQAILPKSVVPVYLLDHPILSTKEIYSAGELAANSPGYAGVEKFIFFSQAALAALKALGWQPNVIHCHDWHTAIIPALLLNSYRADPFFKKTKTLYTIHNLANQGRTGQAVLKTAGLDQKTTIGKSGGGVNLMAQGILDASLINTVSPAYAREILTPAFGAGLDKILKKRTGDLYGILNGLDTDFFNPKTDSLITKNYDTGAPAGKTKNKTALQRLLGLPADGKTALVGLVSRLVWQKGADLITEKFSALDCQFVFLGSGQKKYEAHLTALARKFPRKIKTIIKFDEALAHRIYAGSDIFLVPSRFEPCGLTQLIAMRYGSVPMVRQTGGLADTVNPAVGFSFKKTEAQALYDCLATALRIYYHQPKKWQQLRAAGMKKDFSWGRSARQYLALYKKLLKIKKK